MTAATLERPAAELPAAPITVQPSEGRRDAADRIASDLFRTEPDWVTFFREVLGVDGLVRKLFPSPAELTAFEQTDEYAHIQQMLCRLREPGLGAEHEPTRVITVRLPKSLHESLRAQAHERQTSMNQLCISKLLMELSQA
jgi:predicted HicB family RNase H-like nuclease